MDSVFRENFHDYGLLFSTFNENGQENTQHNTKMVTDIKYTIRFTGYLPKGFEIKSQREPQNK